MASARSRLVAAITRTLTLMVLGLPEPLELARLQHAQQLRLHIERQLADLVEEEGRAVRDLEAADLARQGPGEGALLAAEQLALHEPGRQRGAVDLDHHVARGAG